MKLDYVPEWYSGSVSYNIMQQYGDKSQELRDYIINGEIPRGY